MYSVKPGDLPNIQFYGMLAASVMPRPIALSSTMSKEGVPNLSPFSCFNFFGSNPAILVFSPMRKISNTETKHTLHNVEETREVVINVVTHAMVEQTSLASAPYEEGVSEFDKTGLTMLDSDLVRPKRVAESPIHFECKVNDIIYTGKGGGAPNLVICEVLKMHVDEAMLYDVDNKIDQHKLDLVARMGGNFYTRANAGMFLRPKPMSEGVGYDNLPDAMKNSTVLTGNDLGKLAGIESIPDGKATDTFIKENKLEAYITENSVNKIHEMAQYYLQRNDLEGAWHVLLAKTLKTA